MLGVQNATITIDENPIEYDDETGDRTEKADASSKKLLTDYPCFFYPSAASRRVFADTLRDSVKNVPTATFDHLDGLRIKVGAKATVKRTECDPVVYTIGFAELIPGITYQKWYIELERVDTPA